MEKGMNIQEWAVPGTVTELHLDSGQMRQVPSDFQEIARFLQGLLLNVFWAEEQEVEIPEQRLEEVELRTASRMLERIVELDNRPLDIPRPAGKRLIADARSFAVLYTGFLRAQGIPARVRCGFSTWFRPGLYLEHWLCEAWHAGEERWVLVDPQLDSVQREALGVNFSAVDIPREAFITAGQAWMLCEADEADPDFFGLYEFTGMWFIRGSLVRDVLALAKVELLPWDSFGLIGKDEDELTDEDLGLLDELAEFTQKDELKPAEILAVIEHNPCLQPPMDLF